MRTYTVTVDSVGNIHLPDDIREVLSAGIYDKLDLTLDGDMIVLRPNLAARRRKWIDKWFDRWRFDEAAHTGYMGNITAVELYGEVGISKPCKGDKYDEKTGIAVAYAKAHSADIPKYI